MLIIEGSDCLGKTAFQKKLLEAAAMHDGIPAFASHMSRPNKHFDFFGHYKDMITRYAIQDRFHLGGIVWHNELTQESLDIIEGWNRAEGGITILLYASDEAWYEKRIKEDTRGNLLSIDMMCHANREYKQMAQSKHELNVQIDYSFDLAPMGFKELYPIREDANQVIRDWVTRLRLLETL